MTRPRGRVMNPKSRRKQPYNASGKDGALRLLSTYFALLDPSGVVQFANRATIDGPRSDPSTPPGTKLWDLAFWGASDLAGAAVRQAVERAQRGHEVESDTDFLGTSGDVRLAAFRVLASGEGPEATIVFEARDVTELRAAERHLESREERYRSFVETSMEGIYLFDFDQPIPTSLPVEEQIDAIYRYGKTAACNKLFANMYGYADPGEVVGRRLSEVHGGSHNERNRAFIRTWILSGYRITGALSAEVDRRGRTIHIENSCVGIQGGGDLLRVWGTQQDVTERVEGRRRLESVAQRLELLRQVDEAILAAHSAKEIAGVVLTRVVTLVGCACASVTELDEKSQEFIIFACAGAPKRGIVQGARIPVAMLGSLESLELGDVIMTRVEDRSSPDQLDLAAQGLACYITVPLVARGELVGTLNMGFEEVREQSGEELDLARQIAARLAVAFQQSLLLEKIEASALEIDRRVAERTLELSNERDQAEAADKLKSSLLATLSHELRTPLNSIIGYTTLIRRGTAGPVTREQERQLGVVHGSSYHLLELLDDALDIARIEAGRLEFTIEEFDLSQAVVEVVQRLHPMALERELELAIDLAPELRIESDELRVQQIVTNLVSNAIKFTSRGRIDVSARRVDGGAEVAVQDTGIGIPSDQHERIFEDFVRLRSVSEPSLPGTGLGLGIARRLATCLQGGIAVSSTAGQGSLFTLRLPTSMREEAHAPRHARGK